MDTDDLLIQPKRKTPRFVADCGCKEEWHKTHTNIPCGVRVERDSVPALGYYVCYDCKRESQSAYEKAYQKSHRADQKKRYSRTKILRENGAREFKEWLEKQRHES